MVKKKKRKKLSVKEKLEKAKLKWEKSPISKIAKLAEKIQPSQWVDVVLNLGLAYAGYEAFHDWRAGLLGPVSLKLAQSPNIVAGTSGVIGLVALGVALTTPDIRADFRDWALSEERRVWPDIFPYLKKREEPWVVDEKKIAI